MYVVKWFAMRAACTLSYMVLIDRIQCAATQSTHAEDGQKAINQDADVSVVLYFTLYEAKLNVCSTCFAIIFNFQDRKTKMLEIHQVPINRRTVLAINRMLTKWHYKIIIS